MRLTFLGTGTSTGVPTLGCHCKVCNSPDPHDKRTRPSLMLEFDGRVVIIDTTPDFRSQALRERIERIDAVLFTHSHADHILGLEDVRGFYFRQREPIAIYADSQCMADIRRIFSYIFEGNYRYSELLKVAPHIIEGPWDLWGQRLSPARVFHGDLPVLGFRFGKAAYVTDFSSIPESTMPRLEDLEVLILDALRYKPHPAHSNIGQSLALVERLRARRAFFTHLAHDVGHEETNSKLPEHVRLAYDGLKLEL